MSSSLPIELLHLLLTRKLLTKESQRMLSTKQLSRSIVQAAVRRGHSSKLLIANDQLTTKGLVRSAASSQQDDGFWLLFSGVFVAVTSSYLVIYGDEGSERAMARHFLMNYYENNKNNIVMCEAYATPKTSPDEEGSKAFQVMAALDMRDEVQKVRMAQILYDLHELAKSNAAANTVGPSKLQRHTTVRRMWKYVRRITVPKDANRLLDPTPTASFADYDKRIFNNMTATTAHELIQKLEQGQHFSVKTLNHLFSAAEKTLLKDNTLIDLRKKKYKRVTVIGDLHGSMASLQHVLALIGEVMPKDVAFVFDGDFVDRGENSLEVLLILLLLKLAYPQNVFLLRGNHEDVLVSSAYGFQEEVVQKYGNRESEPIWDLVNNSFCAMPLGLVSDTAAVLHGGLPSDTFDLKELKAISTAQRKNIKSVVEVNNKVDELVQGILWSDPSRRRGIRPNTDRSIGMFYGPDVARDFLERQKLMYLVRGHQVIETGTKVMDCGNGKAVVTVFSQAGYPNGAGKNLGGIVHLNSDGTLEHVEFSNEMALATQAARGTDEQHYVESVKALIAQNKHKLQNTFSLEAPSGKIATTHWASIMAQILEMPNVPWMLLKTELTPSTKDPNTIDWRSFLKLYNAGQLSSRRAANERNLSMEAMKTNQDMIMTTFKFLDSDGNGTIDLNEFRAGIKLLNKRLAKDKKLKDPDKLFNQIDRDGSGEIDLTELQELFKVMA